MNVVIIGDNSSTNLGDPVLTSSALYIVNQIQKENAKIKEVKIFDIAGRSPKNMPLSEKLKEITNFSVDVKNKKAMKKDYQISNIKAFIKWFVKDKKIFTSQLSSLTNENNTNIFIIAGGALLSRSLFYALRLNHIVSMAKKCNGRVIFNAVGIEKCPPTSISRILTRKFLASKNIIAFSTRDQVKEISKITNRKDFFVQVPDPGIYAAEAFDVKKQDSDIVGIGAISLEAYKSVVFEDKRAETITAEDLFNFWYGITSRLDTIGQKWKIFTNGGPKDCRMAYTFLKKYGYSVEEHLVPPAETADELVAQISQFRVVAAHRLHALIIASSLYIPVVPFVWSDKVVKFSESINNNDYFWPDDKKCQQIVDILCCQADTDKILSNISNSKKKSKEFLFDALTKEETK